MFSFHLQSDTCLSRCLNTCLVVMDTYIICFHLLIRSVCYYRPITKLLEGNVFSRVCVPVSLSVHMSGGSMWSVYICSKLFTWHPLPWPQTYSNFFIWTPPPSDLFKLFRLGKRAVGLGLKGLLVLLISAFVISQDFFCAQEFNHNLWFIQFSRTCRIKIDVFDDKVLSRCRHPPWQGNSSDIYFIRKLNRLKRRKGTESGGWFHFHFEKKDTLFSFTFVWNLKKKFSNINEMYVSSTSVIGDRQWVVLFARFANFGFTISPGGSSLTGARKMFTCVCVWVPKVKLGFKCPRPPTSALIAQISLTNWQSINISSPPLLPNLVAKRQKRLGLLPRATQEAVLHSTLSEAQSV